MTTPSIYADDRSPWESFSLPPLWSESTGLMVLKQEKKTAYIGLTWSSKVILADTLNILKGSPANFFVKWERNKRHTILREIHVSSGISLHHYFFPPTSQLSTISDGTNTRAEHCKSKNSNKRHHIRENESCAEWQEIIFACFLHLHVDQPSFLEESRSRKLLSCEKSKVDLT